MRAWRHVVDVFRAQGATNVTWVWCPNVASARSTPMSELYPGDDYVDWTCLDDYNFGTTSGYHWQTFAQVFGGFIQLLVDTNSAGWFSYVIVFGELAVGIGLILGAFTGLAATGGLLMNMALQIRIRRAARPR